MRILDTSSILIGQDGDEAGAEAFVQAALGAMSNGATIRILLLAPTTSAARERAKEIRDQHFDQMVERNIQRLRYLASELPVARHRARTGCECASTTNCPRSACTRSDDRVVVGFLPYRRRSSMTSQLETERHSELGVYAVGQFEQLWTPRAPAGRAALRDTARRTRNARRIGERLLVRAWQVGRTWYVASARIEELLGRRAAAGRSVPRGSRTCQPPSSGSPTRWCARRTSRSGTRSPASTPRAEPGVPVRALTGPPR